MKNRNITYIILFVIWIILHYAFHTDCAIDIKFRLDENTAYDAALASSISYLTLDVFVVIYFFNLLTGIFLLFIITKKIANNRKKKLIKAMQTEKLIVAIIIIEIIIYSGFLLFIHINELSPELKATIFTITHKLGILAIIDTLGLSILLYFSKRIVHIKEAVPGGK